MMIPAEIQTVARILSLSKSFKLLLNQLLLHPQP